MRRLGTRAREAREARVKYRAREAREARDLADSSMFVQFCLLFRLWF